MNKGKGKVVVLSGPSGVGKGTVHQKLINEMGGYELSVSVTTRAPREGEKEGVNYFYRTQEQFDQLIKEGAFVEYAYRYGNSYGTLKSEAERITANNHNMVLDIEYDGALNIKKAFPDALLIFLLPPSLAVLKERIVGRGSENFETLQARYGSAVEEMREYAHYYDYLVVNDDIDACVKQVDAIVKGEVPANASQNLQLISRLIGGQTIC